ncbi:hypothetical protein KBC79_01145 [Candidatus Woesebacteria bacterium]|nr:hypothetical protein [Candidatus Woesebacteria bacterium]
MNRRVSVFLVLVLVALVATFRYAYVSKASPVAVASVTAMDEERMQFIEDDLHTSYYPEDLLIWFDYYATPPKVVFENNHCTPIAVIPAGSYGSKQHFMDGYLFVRYNPNGVWRDNVPAGIVTTGMQQKSDFDAVTWKHQEAQWPGTVWECSNTYVMYMIAALTVMNTRTEPNNLVVVQFQLPVEVNPQSECQVQHTYPIEDLLQRTAEAGLRVELFGFGETWIGFTLENGYTYCVLMPPDTYDSNGLAFSGWSYHSVTREWQLHQTWEGGFSFSTTRGYGRTGLIEQQSNPDGSIKLVFVGDPPPYSSPQQR